MHSRSLIAAVAAAASVALLAGCTGGGSTSESSDVTVGRVTGDLNTVNTVEDVEDGELVFAIEKTINNWNTLSATGDISETVWVTSALYPSAFVIQPDGSTIDLNEDLLESAEVVQESPTVVEYKIRDEAVWSDGVPISVDDFIYQWQALNTRDCPECITHDTDGLDKVVAVEGSDDGKTVTVTFEDSFSEWKRAFNRLLPAHLGEEYGSILDSFNTFFTETPPAFSGGPYIITDFQKDVSVTLEQNPEWWGDPVHLTKVTFRMITDTQQTPVALQNKEIQATYPQPQVDLLQQVESMSQVGVNYQMNQSLVMEAFRTNPSNSFLADPVLRQAIAMAMDSQEIIDKTVGQFDDSVTPLGNLMIMQQQEGYEDHSKELGYGQGDTEGAIALLEGAGYTIEGGQLMTPDGQAVPGLRTVYSVGNAVRESSAQILASAVKPLGITLNLETTDALGNTTSEIAPYGYDIVLLGYTGSPFVASNAFKRYTTGTGYNPHYSNPEVDALVDEALRATSQDEVLELINEADRMVVGDAFLIPIYQKPSLFAYYREYGNLRDNPTVSGPTYNMQDWGIIPGVLPE
ncbi:ABC transporter family substrate-binding protein [Agromyces aerolatus]|uniref:ABC transporter family substrate-binding protein n=1 Tax=Agromyces sp. LY-1074 TaxID=3074080 RepID=UPI00285B42B7|nr:MULTISPECIES: ABC transporter family substrate-binding protein [unclassified Agromyces]MDR5701395.1 ABC transporter family substrate-binding protein [Agromyces sp. LY-1074]MDR5706816.1 ABC transporter family substrate-binding protein [Agromyces sp. LY-1358]